MKRHLQSLIIDDESKARDNLRAMLQSYCPEVKVISEADSAFSGKYLIDRMHPDLIFLDINMPTINGLQLLEVVDSKKMMTIITSAYAEFCMQALSKNVIAYLLKPIVVDDLKATLYKVQQLKEIVESGELNMDGGQLKVKDEHGFKFIPVKDIKFLASSSNYSILHLANGQKQLVSKTLKLLEMELQAYAFFRLNRSIIINLQYIKSYKSGSVVLKDASTLKVSRRRQKAFLQVMANSLV